MDDGLLNEVLQTRDHGADIAQLWSLRKRVIAEERLASRAVDEASDKVPWWAKPGPSYLFCDGSMGGPISGWPALQNVTPPEYKNVHKNIRPSPSSVKESARSYGLMWGEERARAIYRRDLRAIVLRRRAADLEGAKVDLPRLEAELETLTTAVIELDDALISGAAECSAAAIAANALLGLQNSMSLDDPLDCDPPEVLHLKAVLQAVRSALTGDLANSVDEILHPPFPDRPYRTLTFAMV